MLSKDMTVVARNHSCLSYHPVSVQVTQMCLPLSNNLASTVFPQNTTTSGVVWPRDRHTDSSLPPKHHLMPMVCVYLNRKRYTLKKKKSNLSAMSISSTHKKGITFHHYFLEKKEKRKTFHHFPSPQKRMNFLSFSVHFINNKRTNFSSSVFQNTRG